MYATGAFKNPFADFDFSKIAGEFKMPTMKKLKKQLLWLIRHLERIKNVPV